MIVLVIRSGMIFLNAAPQTPQFKPHDSTVNNTLNPLYKLYTDNHFAVRSQSVLTFEPLLAELRINRKNSGEEIRYIHIVALRIISKVLSYDSL